MLAVRLCIRNPPKKVTVTANRSSQAVGRDYVTQNMSTLIPVHVRAYLPARALYAYAGIDYHGVSLFPIIPSCWAMEKGSADRGACSFRVRLDVQRRFPGLGMVNLKDRTTRAGSGGRQVRPSDPVPNALEVRKRKKSSVRREFIFCRRFGFLCACRRAVRPPGWRRTQRVA